MKKLKSRRISPGTSRLPLCSCKLLHAEQAPSTAGTLSTSRITLHLFRNLHIDLEEFGDTSVYAH